MKNLVRIGTRSSDLALFQAHKVQSHLTALGCDTKIIPIKSKGDINLQQPLYDMGIVGVFTKALDIALLNNTIDIAVHSMKDVPTRLPKGLEQGAVIKRGEVQDSLVLKNDQTHFDQHCTIATGSLRRQAQWLNKYPHHTVENIRGNIQMRLKKLEQTLHWNGIILADAGLKRMKITSTYQASLEWMIPAPAQGAITINCRKDDAETINVLARINDPSSEQCVKIEREFLNTLEGGCSAPVGALATQKEHQIHFKGILLSEDGKQKVEIHEKINLDETENVGNFWAKKILNNGGEAIIKSLKR